MESGCARRSYFKGRERAIVNQTNFGTVSKAFEKTSERGGGAHNVWTLFFFFFFFLFLFLWWCFTSTETTRLIRDGEKRGGGGMEVGGEGDYITIATLSPPE